MFLIDHAPHVASQARAFSSRLRTVAPVLYKELLRPMPETEALYLAVSSQIQRHKHRSVDERRLMHEYASSLLLRDGAIPRGMDKLLVCYVEKLLEAQRFRYRQLHPFRMHRKAAA